MALKQGFASSAGHQAAGPVPEVGIGMLGYAFMGKAHSNAFKTIPYMMYPPVAIPKLVAICGRDEAGVAEAARRYGYETYYTDWRKMVEDPRVQLFDNGGPNDMHAEPIIAAARAGKHVFCEKPLARTTREARDMRDAAVKAGVKHQTAYSLRFVPAVRQAYELIRSGKLGKLYHFRAAYLQEWILPHYNTAMNWRLDKARCGSGSLGDLGSHIIDLARFLMGEVTSVGALARTFIDRRPLPDGTGSAKVEVDDAIVSVVEFANGGIGTVEATRFAAGNKNHATFEVNGEKGSIRFNLERLNELEVFWVGDEPRETQGFHQINVTEGYHPFMSNWWPHGHIIGWEHAFIHEFNHFLDCIVNDREVGPCAATFEDGYRNVVISDAILESAASRRQVDVKY
jgi:predicted dehydrogenase